MNSAALAESGVADIVEAFENATLEPGGFDHEAHILVAWHYLQDMSLIDAIARFTRAIKRLTRKLGVASKYHETITWFYLIKIAERCKAEPGADWPRFRAANPDLFARKPTLVEKYYSRTLLASATARRMFVLPDLEA
jgi:hypothetical protein